jgi:hypothetical protein
VRSVRRVFDCVYVCELYVCACVRFGISTTKILQKAHNDLKGVS